MAQKFDSTAHERGTTATIPRHYYAPKKSEAYWKDVVDEGVGKSGLPNKTRRQSILNLLEDTARRDAVVRLGLQSLIGDDPSASGVVALKEWLPTSSPNRKTVGTFFRAEEGIEPHKEYQHVRKQVERHVARGKAPSHLPPTDFDSSLPEGAFVDRPIMSYTTSFGYPGDRPHPPTYDPAYERGIISLLHEARHAGLELLKQYVPETKKDMREFHRLFEPLRAPIKTNTTPEEMLVRAYEAKDRARKPLAKHFIPEWQKREDRLALGMYPKPHQHPVQSAAEEMLRDQYAGRELYAPLARQPR
jgi:hypothetical protein